MKKHSTRFLALVTEAKGKIHEITPQQLKEKLDQGDAFFLVDVREESEWASGHIPTAIHLSKGTIERDIEKEISDLAAPILVYCSGGFRSALVAESLQKMGYTNVSSLKSGSQGWLGAGHAFKK